jgi:hypothetical protein
VAAFVALVLVGIGLMAFAWLLAKWVRRSTRLSRRRPSKGPIGPSDWEPQPWVPADESNASGADDTTDE